MRYLLENEELQAEVDSLGAEMKSLVIKQGGQEMLWGGSPEYWGETSPVLFPFIGKLKDFQYTYEGRQFTMTKHGFAKRMEFRTEIVEKDRIVLTLDSNPETLESYPFLFRLEAEYRLAGAGVEVRWRVHNRGEEPMYFSMGGHPGFLCPPNQAAGHGVRRTDCSLKLHGAEGRSSLENLCVGDDGLLSGETIQLAVKDGILPVTEHIFDDDALLLREQGVRAVGLCDGAGKEYVRVESDAPVWGIWSVADSNAGYICIEPWFGICDRTDYAGTLQERPLGNRVSGGETWQGGYRIAVGRSDS